MVTEHILGAEEPEGHVHEYGEPEFIWSEDCKNCTIVFTCADGDDQQKIECEVTSEITDATCTENGYLPVSPVMMSRVWNAK